MKEYKSKLNKRIEKLEKKTKRYEAWFGPHCEKYETMFMLALTVASASMVYFVGMWAVGIIPVILSGILTAGLYTFAGLHSVFKKDYITSMLELRELKSDKVVDVNLIKEYGQDLKQAQEHEQKLLTEDNVDKNEIKRVRLIKKLSETKYKAANFKFGCMIEDGINNDIAKHATESQENNNTTNI